MSRARLFFVCALVSAAVSCGTESGDEYEVGALPPPAGTDARLREIADPESPEKADHLDPVTVSGVTVVAVDTYDETGDGRGRGGIFVQDLGSQAPYSGISLFAPTFIPGNLKVSAGDVLDLRGEYQENASIGTVTFATGSVLPQISRPTATFRFEFRVPEPVDIDVADLGDFAKGRRWLGMLVRVRNVTLHDDVTRDAVGTSGRLSANLLPRDPNARACDYPFPKPPTLVNELADIADADIAAGTVVKSITGIVTFFCNIHLAPRSLADIER